MKLGELLVEGKSASMFLRIKNNVKNVRSG